MKQIINNKAIISNKNINESFEYENITVLKVDIDYPNIKLAKGYFIQLKINAYFKKIADTFFNYAKNMLLPTAIDDYKNSKKEDYPFNPYEVVMKYTTTLNLNCTLSNYFDQYQFTGGAHGNTKRISNTINLQTSNLIKLKDLFKTIDYKNTLLHKIQIQAEQNMIKEPNIYFENYKELIIENFKEENFFLDSKSINIYYQQYDIAPYSSGIIVFNIPYKELGIIGPYCKI